jgi:dipeptidyl aminopeptidase/acylaminoacyl peptidase
MSSRVYGARDDNDISYQESTMTGRQPIKPHDLQKLRFIQEAQLSPDGGHAVFSLLWTDVEAGQDHISLWVVSTRTGESYQLTAGQGKDTQPVWSPDGREILFVREMAGEKPQLYAIRLAGGEARPLTHLPQGVSGRPAWSPDGTRVAFTAPPAPVEREPSAPYRVNRHMYRFDGVGYIQDHIQEIFVLERETGQVRQLTADGWRYAAPVWAPDGQELLFLALMPPNVHQPYAVIKCVNLDGEVFSVLDGWGYASAVTWTRDGASIVFVGNPFAARRGTQDRLWVTGRAGGVPECRTAGLDLCVGGMLQDDMPFPAITPRLSLAGDGRHVYVQVQEGGAVPIYRVALHGQEAYTPVVGGERTCILQGHHNGRLLFLESTLNRPLDLVLSTLESGTEQRLTNVNGGILSQHAMPDVAELRFTSADGTPVEGWLLVPPTGEAPHSAILYIHGGPHSGFGHVFSCDFQALAGAGYAVLLINQRGSTGYGDAFSQRITGDWGNLDYADLMAGVDFAIERGLADPQRLGVCGLSGGGYLTCWIIGHTDRFKAAVPENPVTNFHSFFGVSDIGPWFAAQELGGRPHEIPDVYRRCSPITYAHRCTTPTLLIQSENDWRCPAEQSEQFYTALKVAGCRVEMLRLPGGSHTAAINGLPRLRGAQSEALLDWMKRFIQPEIGSQDV